MLAAALLLCGCGLLPDHSADGMADAVSQAQAAIARGDLAGDLKTRYCRSTSEIPAAQGALTALKGEAFVACAISFAPAANMKGPVYVVDLTRGRRDASMRLLPKGLRAKTLGDAPMIA
jgi:hypothetical protein